MATIRTKKRADGSLAYRAEIRIKRKGEVIHRESKTFNRKADAERWAKKREVTLDEPGALESLTTPTLTVGQLVNEYRKEVSKVKPWGRSKEAVLKTWLSQPEADLPANELTAKTLIDFATRRIDEGVKPQTVTVDLSHLRSVFSVAEDMLGVPVSLEPFTRSHVTLKKLDLVSKSATRERRPTVEEMTKIMEYFATLDSRRSVIPIAKIIVFAMFSARRAEEITNLLWADLDRANKRILVRNMKDPKKKKGNDILTVLPDEALAVIESMPQEGERIFPYNHRSLGTAFQRVKIRVGLMGIEDDLHFHDLRHEALSWLAEKHGLPNENWDIPRLLRVSGHRSWNMLQRYVNILESEPFDKWKDWEWKTRVL